MWSIYLINWLLSIDNILRQAMRGIIPIHCWFFIIQIMLSNGKYPSHIMKGIASSPSSPDQFKGLTCMRSDWRRGLETKMVAKRFFVSLPDSALDRVNTPNIVANQTIFENKPLKLHLKTKLTFLPQWLCVILSIGRILSRNYIIVGCWPPRIRSQEVSSIIFRIIFKVHRGFSHWTVNLSFKVIFTIE